IDAILAPAAYAALSARSTGSDVATVTSLRPGTTIVSASAAASMPWSVAMRIGPAVTTGSTPQTSTRYPGLPVGSDTRPNVSTAVLKSNAIVSGNARTAMVCTARQ